MWHLILGIVSWISNTHFNTTVYLCNLVHRYPDQISPGGQQQVDNRNEQMADPSSMNGRIGPSYPNRQDRPDQRPGSNADGHMIGQSARPQDRLGFQSGQPRPYGEDIDGRRSPSRRILLDDPKDKVGLDALILN